MSRFKAFLITGIIISEVIDRLRFYNAIHCKHLNPLMDYIKITNCHIALFYLQIGALLCLIYRKSMDMNVRWIIGCGIGFNVLMAAYSIRVMCRWDMLIGSFSTPLNSLWWYLSVAIITYLWLYIKSGTFIQK